MSVKMLFFENIFWCLSQKTVLPKCKTWFWLACIGLFANSLQAQSLCAPGQGLANTCAVACVVCDLNGYANTTVQMSPGQAPPGYCTQIVHTMGWVGFVAGSVDVTFDVEVFPCTQGNSIEMGVYSTPNCSQFTLVSNCNTAMFQNNTYSFNNTAPLTPGCTYYLVFDNNGPASCPFEVTVTNGSATAPPMDPPPPPQGPTVVCPGATVAYSISEVTGTCEYVWTSPAGSLINGMASPLRLSGPGANMVEIMFGSTGGNVCVDVGNACNNPAQACLPVTVMPIPPTILPPVSICNGESFDWINGEMYNSSQTLAITLASWLGCDSTINQQLIVDPPITTNLGLKWLCEGECFELSGQLFCDPGYQNLVLTSFEGCDSTVFFTINFLPAVAVILPSDTLTCLIQSVLLNGSMSTPGVTYAWYGGAQGQLGNAPTQLVNLPDTFWLVVRRANAFISCLDTAMVIVPYETTPPVVSALGDTLDCYGNAVQLQSNIGTPGAPFVWSGPGIDSTNQNQEDPWVTVPGTYYLTATNPANGCIGQVSVVVFSDTNAPQLSLNGTDTLSCIQLVTTLTASTNDPDAVLGWTGPNGFADVGDSITVILPGTYFATATALNGCLTQAAITVAQDTAAPVVAAQGDTLSCTQSFGYVTAFYADSLATFSWTGPGGFADSAPQPAVSAPGVYTVVATAFNGCTASAQALVVPDDATPLLNATTPFVLTCIQRYTFIVGSATPSDVVLSWAGPGGFSATGDSLLVSQPGTYWLIGTAVNGCVDSLVVLVEQDILPPALTGSGGLVTCVQSQTTITGQSSAPGTQFYWSGPGGFTSTSASPSVLIPGNYFLTGTAPNGCSATLPVSVVADTMAPVVQVSLPATPLNCTITQISAIAQSSVPGSVFAWFWNGSPVGTSVLQVIDQPGMYTVVASAPNGCTGSQDTMVFEDIVMPDVFAAGDTLDCFSNQAFLSGGSATPGTVLNWTGPGNFMSTSATPTVAATGTYVLWATGPNGCLDSEQVQVLPPPGLPPVVILPYDTITCALPLTVLAVQLPDPGIAYIWTGPGGFNIMSSSATVSTSGSYTVVATNVAGCSLSASAVVFENVVAPVVAATGGVITCTQPSVVLNVQASSGTLMFVWTGPSGFTSVLPEPTVVVVGTYLLSVTAANGCTAVADGMVSADTTAPVISATGGTLSCANPNLTLGLSLAPQGIPVAWTGPAQFTSTINQPVVNQPGIYSVTATATNGCTASAAASVTSDQSIPMFSTTGGAITCTTTQVVLAATGFPAGSTVSWSGPGGFLAAGQQILVVQAGNYQATVTAMNGCTAVQTAVASTDTVHPVVTLEAETITCNRPQATISATVMPSNAGLSWSGPQSGLPSASQVAVGTPGWYTLTAVLPSNGCTAEASAEVEENIPHWFLELGPDQTVWQDTYINFEIQTDLPEHQRATVSWTPEFPCNTCLRQFLRAQDSLVLYVLMEDEEGCVKTDAWSSTCSNKVKCTFPMYLHPKRLAKTAFSAFMPVMYSPIWCPCRCLTVGANACFL